RARQQHDGAAAKTESAHCGILHHAPEAGPHCLLRPGTISYNVTAAYGAFMLNSALAVPPTATVRDALEAITNNGRQAVLVVDAAGRLAGLSPTATPGDGSPRSRRRRPSRCSRSAGSRCWRS